jgi:phosphatidylserine decarboxylase
MSFNRKSIAEPAQTGSLRFLYQSTPGRALLKLLVNPFFSRLGGAFMNSRFSRGMIPSFIEKNQIDMTQYEEGPFFGYNDFFSRKIRPDARSFDLNPASLISPCDSKLSAYVIDADSLFTIKDTAYTICDLVRDPGLAGHYAGGYCLIFRLTVDDYHRYCYIDDCTKGANVFLPGKLHTVQPIALRAYNIYKENSREYTVMETAHFGKVTQVEVGALMVGRIKNHHDSGSFARGEEKGMFQFGGSTIVLLLEKDKAVLDQDILDNTALQRETVVKIGERIGSAR